MNASGRLTAAREAMREGRYAEALEGFIWFHHHALGEQPSLRGVRLSFALGSWFDMFELYPPARDAYMNLREEKSLRLLDGELEWHLFNDVVAMNEITDDPSHTYRLFLEIEKLSQKFATQCSRLAAPALVKCGDYVRARGYIKDPEAWVEGRAACFADDFEKSAAQSDTKRRYMRMQSDFEIYAQDIELITSIVGGAGEHERSASLRELAIREGSEGRTAELLSRRLKGDPVEPFALGVPVQLLVATDGIQAGQAGTVMSAYVVPDEVCEVWFHDADDKLIAKVMVPARNLLKLPYLEQ